MAMSSVALYLNKEEIVQQTIHNNKPALLIGPRYTGKRLVYNLIKEQLIYLSEEVEFKEIVIDFDDDLHKPLIANLRHENAQNSLIDYLIKSPVLVDFPGNVLVKLSNLHKLKSKKKVNWLLRGLLDQNFSGQLNKIGVTLVVEGRISKEFISGFETSPFDIEIRNYKPVNHNEYLEFINSLAVKLQTEEVEKLWEITNGDEYFTKGILGQIDLNSVTDNKNRIEEGLYKYCNLGTFNDEFKYNMLRALLLLNIQLNENPFCTNFEDLKKHVDENWASMDQETQIKCYAGGLVIDDGYSLKLRSPKILKPLLLNAIKRAENVEKVINSTLEPSILKTEQKNKYHQTVSEIKEGAYYGVLTNSLIGLCKRTSETEVFVKGVYDLGNDIELIWNNNDKLALSEEAFLMQYELNYSSDEEQRFIKILRFNE